MQAKMCDLADAFIAMPGMCEVHLPSWLAVPDAVSAAVGHEAP